MSNQTLDLCINESFKRACRNDTRTNVTVTTMTVFEDEKNCKWRSALCGEVNVTHSITPFFHYFPF